jgi:glycine/D-amino acid oxidase-like deaminating enzyme
VEWFHSDEGHPVETKYLQEILAELLPRTSFKSFGRKPCIVTYTAHNYPYIAAVDGKSAAEAQVFVCTGGCGAAAKSSDEIGRIGALLVSHRKWNYDLDERLFKGVSATTSKLEAKMIPHV